MGDLISRQAVIELIHSLYPSAPIMRMNRKRWKKKYKPYIEVEKALEMFPSAEKADYIMALHKEYGCTLCSAEEAHNKALEHLRSKATMKG